MRRTVLLLSLLLWQVSSVLACPKECRCSGTSVDCSGQGLDRVPEDLPIDTTDL